MHVVERGGDGLPLLVIHGGPGLDHHLFGDYLDPLGDDVHLVLVDLRSQGLSDKTPPETWTLERMATDLSELAEAMGFERYATLGHSYGAFVVLQHAVDRAGEPAATIVSSGLPSARYLERGAGQPRGVRADRATRAGHLVVGARGRRADEADCAALLHDQLPFHFARPARSAHRGVRAAHRRRRLRADVLRHFAIAEYGSIEVEDRLGRRDPPVLVLAGRTTAPARSRAPRRSPPASPARSSRCSRRARTSRSPRRTRRT